jgi:hypothetical protein
LLAVSTLFVTRPRATDSQVSANVTITRTAIAASHSSGFAVGRNPTSSATPMTAAGPIIVWSIDGGELTDIAIHLKHKHDTSR